MVKVGTAYGALGSEASVVTPALVVSEILLVRGTDPVSSTIMMPKNNMVIPKLLQNYQQTIQRAKLHHQTSRNILQGE
jgi:hypothetical protein